LLGLDAVLPKRRQVLKQSLEAMNGPTLVGLFAPGLVPGPEGAVRRRHDGQPERVRGGLVVIIEKHRGERTAHGPLDVIGEHAEKDVGSHSIGQPVMDRPDVKVHPLQTPKRPFDDGEGHGIARVTV
jgi:hypothetical protein